MPKYRTKQFDIETSLEDSSERAFRFPGQKHTNWLHAGVFAHIFEPIPDEPPPKPESEWKRYAFSATCINENSGKIGSLIDFAFGRSEQEAVGAATEHSLRVFHPQDFGPPRIYIIEVPQEWSR